jgi:hypothetical protein
MNSIRSALPRGVLWTPELALLPLFFCTCSCARPAAPDNVKPQKTSAAVKVLDLSKAQRLTIGVGQESTTLERTSAGRWELSASSAGNTNHASADGVIDALTQARFESRPEAAPEESAGEAAAASDCSVSVRFEDGSSAELRIHRERPFDGSVFVQRIDDSTSGLLPGAFRFAVCLKPRAFIEAHVLSFDFEAADELSLDSSTHAWTMKRDAKRRWCFVPKRTLCADKETIAAMAAKFQKAKAQDFIDLKSPQAQRLLQKKAIATLRISSSPAETVTLSMLSKENADTVAVLRQHKEQKTLSLVPSQPFSFALQPARHFFDRSLVVDSLDAVDSVTFHSPGAELKLQRAQADAGFSAWRVVSPQPGVALQIKIAAWLWTLSQLKQQRTEHSDRALKQAFLSSEKRRVTLSAGSKVLADIELGSALPGDESSRVVRVDGGRYLLIDAEALRDFPTSVGEVLDASATAQ